MRNNRNIITEKVFVYAVFVFCLFSTTILTIQSQEYKENSIKRDVDLAINYNKTHEDLRTVIVTLSYREEGIIKFVKGEIVNLYLNDVSKNGMLGNVITDEKGNGEFQLISEKFKKASDSLTAFTFIASFKNSMHYTDAETSLTIYDGKLDLDCYTDDSTKYIKAVLNRIDSGKNLLPVEFAQVHFYVRRLFNLLPIGGDYTYTDENGEVVIEFPNDLPGDGTGMVDILVRIEDDEDLGNLSYQISKKWGVPSMINTKFNRRSLWASRANAPVSLIVISLAIILGVWVVIFYLIIQLYNIKKKAGKN